MERFEKFTDFIYNFAIYPVAVSLVAAVCTFASALITGKESMPLIYLCLVLFSIVAAWMLVFLVVYTANKIIEWQIDHGIRKEHDDEEADD